MAKQFIDAAIETDKDAMVKQDGTALTLTNGVRILYEDTLNKRQLMVLIDRIRNRINELEVE